MAVPCHYSLLMTTHAREFFSILLLFKGKGGYFYVNIKVFLLDFFCFQLKLLFPITKSIAFPLEQQLIQFC